LTLRGFIAPFVIDRPVNRIIFKTYVEKILLPELQPGDIIVMDNLSSHKGPRVREMIESVGARLEYLPPYSPDFNPIENAFSKLKALLRKAAERSISGLWTTIGRLPNVFTPNECQNYFAAARYDATGSDSALVCRSVYPIGGRPHLVVLPYDLGKSYDLKAFNLDQLHQASLISALTLLDLLQCCRTFNVIREVVRQYRKLGAAKVHNKVTRFCRELDEVAHPRKFLAILELKEHGPSSANASLLKMKIGAIICLARQKQTVTGCNKLFVFQLHQVF
jgi:transposase